MVGLGDEGGKADSPEPSPSQQANASPSSFTIQKIAVP